MSDSSTTVLYTGRFLALIKQGRWEYAHRTNGTGAAIIVAVTPEGRLLLVEQYRIPVATITIELPAGIVGDQPGVTAETDLVAVRRELIEESGYDAESFDVLTHGPASSGLTSETVTFFRAKGLHRVSQGGGVAHEKINVHEISLAEIDAWLKHRASGGALIDPKVYAGLYFLGKKQ